MWERVKGDLPMILLWLLATTAIISSSALLWERAGTPEKIDYHTTSYTDKSQWQAMMIMNGETPFQIDHFIYDAQANPPKPEETTADAMLRYLKGRCLFWLSTLEPYRAYNRNQIIQCFTKRTDLKKFEKDK